jgi:hypothetical protein
VIRRFALPVVATLLVAATLAITAASGGGDYVVRPARNPCTAATSPRPTDIDRLGEAVVLSGLDVAACDLKVTRERLLLGLATPGSRRDFLGELRLGDVALTTRVRAGLSRGIARLEQAGRLPKVSELLPSLLDQANLPGLLKSIARGLPADVVDSLLPTGPTLRRAVRTLDLGRVLNQLDDRSRLETALRDAIVGAAVAEARDRLVAAAASRTGPLGGVISGIFGK